MIKAVHPIKKSHCCKSQEPKPSIFKERSKATQAGESNQPGEPSPLMQCSLMDLPGRAPMQPKVVTGEQQTTGIAEKSASPVIQRYVKVGLYEGSFGLDHIGVGVNSEKTLGFSPKEELGREAEKGSWVDGEVKEDHGLLDSLTIRTNPRQEARLEAALNRAESSPLKFNLQQHNCSQHGAEILKSAGLNAKSSPIPRAFFEGLKKQYASGQKEAAGDGGPLQGKFASNAPAAAEPGTRPNRTGMPDRLKSGIESLSGMDMSDVRVHPNSELPERMNALAYTQGNQIYLGPGEERHLSHEAWHVVQQKQGRVRATRQMKGVGVNDDLGLEGEADEISKRELNESFKSATSPIQFAIRKPEKTQMMEETVKFDETQDPSSKKFMGYIRRPESKIKMAIWWDKKNGVYVNFKGRKQGNIRSERYFAEGTGYHAFNIARDYYSKQQPTLVKGTEFKSIGSMSGDWQESVRRLGLQQQRGRQLHEAETPNLKMSYGGATGDVHKFRRSHTTPPRKHDLIQLTFPRSDKEFPKESDSEAERSKAFEAASESDAQLIADFLQYAQLRLKETGEVRVVLINSYFYNNAMANAIRIVSNIAQRNGYSMSFVTSIPSTERLYQKDPKFWKDTPLPYTHDMTDKRSSPPSEIAHGDIIYTFTFRPIAGASSAASADTSSKNP